MALEAVTGKKGERDEWAGLMRNLSHLKQVDARRPRGCLSPELVKTTHNMSCMPAEIFKVRVESRQAIFWTASATLEEG